MTAEQTEAVDTEVLEDQESTNDEEVKDEQQESENEDSMPDWARAKLTKANQQAANYRTQLREAQEALAKAKTPEEFEAATTDLSKKVEQLEVGLLRATVINKHKLSDEAAEFLTGSNEEELEASATKLAALLQTKAQPKTRVTNPGGGLDPSDNDEDVLDPRKLRKIPGRRRF